MRGDGLRLQVEVSVSGKPSFVYVTYIATTPEKLWRALTDETISEQFWFGYRVVSDWTVGSSFRLMQGERIVTDEGIVLECDPPRRLSYTWKPTYEEMRHEPPSKVTFDIEPRNDQVKLTVTHEQFEVGSKVFESISTGWPAVLSSLKSFLETGSALPPSWTGVHEKIIAAAGAKS